MGLSIQARVGIFFFIAMIVLAGMITWKSDLFLRQRGYELIGSFNNIEGLTVGSEVRYRGYKVGKIMKIDPGPEDVRINVLVNRDIRFPADSSLRVSFDGIVGLKFLEIRPGVSTELFQAGGVLYGKSTSGIVDFVDIGAQNLIEMKKIMIVIREFVEDPKIKQAFFDAVITTDKITKQVDQLTKELRTVTQSIADIVSDPEFQANVKGTMASTHQTLANANNFFESAGSLKVRPSADLYFGNLANQVRANLDILYGKSGYVRLGVGEGPTRSLSLQDILISNRVNQNTAYKIGIINSYLGGGVDVRAWEGGMFSGDVYDINNRPGYPKVRLTASQKVANSVDLAIQADDVLNSGNANYSFGVKINDDPLADN
ncbi:MAG: MlaD family protein [Candidatus Saganbacteria bacterium]|nr:MlaD family protein [Candidatus Saganbacteria bacterium]